MRQSIYPVAENRPVYRPLPLSTGACRVLLCCFFVSGDRIGYCILICLHQAYRVIIAVSGLGRTISCLIVVQPFHTAWAVSTRPCRNSSGGPGKNLPKTRPEYCKKSTMTALRIFCSGETCMNRGSSQRNHENRRFDGTPPQGTSRGTAGQFSCFLKCSRLLTRRGGAPLWGGGVHRK